MGYIRHHAAIAVVPDYGEGCDEARAAIIKLQQQMGADNNFPATPQCIFGPVMGINDYQSWAFLPDGSKEGWGVSDTADDYRKDFISAARLAEYASVVELIMGGDDCITQILFSTDSDD